MGIFDQYDLVVRNKLCRINFIIVNFSRCYQRFHVENLYTTVIIYRIVAIVYQHNLIVVRTELYRSIFCVPVGGRLIQNYAITHNT